MTAFIDREELRKRLQKTIYASEAWTTHTTDGTRMHIDRQWTWEAIERVLDSMPVMSCETCADLCCSERDAREDTPKLSRVERLRMGLSTAECLRRLEHDGYNPARDETP